MSRFLQLHLLTFYPPANLNRDDIGRPKTAVIGGTTRLRVSSQALKRAWRKSEVFEKALFGHLGDRTARIGRDVALAATTRFGFEEIEAQVLGRFAAAVFGKLDAKAKPGQELFTKQLAFISPTERGKLDAFLKRAAEDEALRSRLRSAAAELVLDPDGGDPETTAEDDHSTKKAKKPKQSKATTELIKQIRSEILTLHDTAVDIAMFGRMLADSPDYNCEAAVQVAHAVTTHAVPIEDDFYTAVDDLKKPSEDAGAGFVGEAGFGSGVFYLYACIDQALLLRNLGGDAGLAGTSIAALVEAAATVSPGGKQASFASRARAHYLLAERGDAQPRTLGAAFAKPVGDDPVHASVSKLRAWRADLDQAYGGAEAHAEMAVGEAGTLADVIAFCRA